MTRPTPDQIDVALDALDAESRLWSDLSQRLNVCARLVTDLRITDFQHTTVFDGFLAGYNQVCETFTQRSTAGAEQTFEIGVRLLTVAQVYAREEETNVHAQQQLY